jgi:hypothetical protein
LTASYGAHEIRTRNGFTLFRVLVLYVRGDRLLSAAPGLQYPSRAAHVANLSSILSNTLRAEFPHPHYPVTEEIRLMSRKFLSFVLLAALSATACAQQPKPPAAPAQAQNAPPAAPKTHLKVGDPAPDFTLSNTKGEKVKLSDFKGRKNVVLAFYVLAFTGG